MGGRDHSRKSSGISNAESGHREDGQPPWAAALRRVAAPVRPESPSPLDLRVNGQASSAGSDGHWMGTIAARIRCWSWPQRTTAMMKGVVREGGVEPPRPFGHTDLNRARLPIPPLARARRGLERLPPGPRQPRIAADGWPCGPEPAHDTIRATSCSPRRSTRPWSGRPRRRRCGGHPRPLRATLDRHGQRCLRPGVQGRGAAGGDRRALQRECDDRAAIVSRGRTDGAQRLPRRARPRPTTSGSPCTATRSPRSSPTGARARRRAGLRSSSARSTVDLDAGRRPRDRACSASSARPSPGEIPRATPHLPPDAWLDVAGQQAPARPRPSA